jgi:hypothetical protein
VRKTALFAIIAALFGVLAVSPASAARQDAADFAADCNDDGVVEVDGRQRYVGGTGVLAGDCSVHLATGARLTLRRVNLSGPGNLVAISSPANTTIRVIKSTIVVDGALELTAGCCSGEGDGSERNGRVVVRRSTLSGKSVQLLASFDDPNGRVVVRRSRLTATGELGIQIRAGDLGGENGRVRVRRSILDSGGPLQIRTGTDGRTAVRRNRASFVGEADVSTGENGRCISRRNKPELPCSPSSGGEEESGSGRESEDKTGVPEGESEPGEEV